MLDPIKDLKQLIADSGLKESDIAKEAGMLPSNFRNILNERDGVTVKKIRHISAAIERLRGAV